MKRFLIYVLALCTPLAFAGCGDDDPAGPPGGGGGSPAFSLPAGIYNTSFSFETCGGLPIENSASIEIWCEDEVINQLPGDLSCSPTAVGTDSVVINCSGSEDNGICSYDWTATGGGSKKGDVWTLRLRLEFMNESPPGCADAPVDCIDVILSAERVSEPPTACSYADVNRYEATVVGGPMAGEVPFYISGGSTSPGSVGQNWNFAGFYTTSQLFLAPSAAGVGGRNWGVNVNLVDVDPKSVPTTVPVTIIGELVSSARGIGSTANYSEYDADAETFFTATGGTGTVDVRQMSPEHIAGNITLNVQGTDGSKVLKNRTVSGGFYVDVRTLNGPVAISLPQRIARQMLQSLRSHVE